jgi:hypothetical protein
MLSRLVFEDGVILILRPAGSREHPFAPPRGLFAGTQSPEHVWDELGEKEFPNRVFESMGAVARQLEAGLPRLVAHTQALQSLTAWPWMVKLNLIAN